MPYSLPVVLLVFTTKYSAGKANNKLWDERNAYFTQIFKFML